MEQSASGKDIVREIVRSMREKGEELYYSHLVPTVYQVYLHRDDYLRLKEILPAIQEQAERALTEELSRINREHRVAARVRSVLKVSRRKHAPARASWTIEVLMDSEGELAPGDIHVYSSLAVPEPAAYEGGSPTRRIRASAPSRPGPAAVDTAEKIPPPSGTQSGTQEIDVPRGVPLAMLTYEDADGRKTYRIEKPHIVIGRGGSGYWVDLRLKTVPDVSREHVRLRRDEKTGQFYIKDLSTLGTTLDGAAIPSSIETVDGERRDRDIEVPLPQRAVIGLAGAIFLEFRIGGNETVQA